MRSIFQDRRCTCQVPRPAAAMQGMARIQADLLRRWLPCSPACRAFERRRLRLPFWHLRCSSTLKHGPWHASRAQQREAIMDCAPLRSGLRPLIAEQCLLQSPCRLLSANSKMPDILCQHGAEWYLLLCDRAAGGSAVCYVLPRLAASSLGLNCLSICESLSDLIFRQYMNLFM